MPAVRWGGTGLDGGGDTGGLEPGLGLEGVVILDAQGVLGEDAGAVGLRPGEDLEGLVQSREGAKGLLMRGVFLAAWREFLPGRPAGRGGGDRGHWCFASPTAASALSSSRSLR